MRKLILILLLIILFATVQMSGMINQSKFSITVGAGVKNISEEIFKTVYGTGNIAYSIDLAYKLGKTLELFVHTDYFKADGELLFDPK